MKCQRTAWGSLKWLFHENNPLTARVAVNRYWQMLFGTGLVKTPEDFGSQGAMPTHPQLLDWLAVRLPTERLERQGHAEANRDVGNLLPGFRTTQQMIEKDPSNELLARGSRFRLSAFAIRDQALAVSGLLSHRKSVARP